MTTVNMTLTQIPISDIKNFNMTTVNMTLTQIPISDIFVHNMSRWKTAFLKTPEGEYITSHMKGDFDIVEKLDPETMTIKQYIEVRIEEKHAVFYQLKFGK